MTEDVLVAEVGGAVVRPAERRSGVDVDVDGDTVADADTLGQTRRDVGHRERVGRAQRVSVVHHAPRRPTHCTHTQLSLASLWGR